MLGDRPLQTSQLSVYERWIKDFLNGEVHILQDLV